VHFAQAVFPSRLSLGRLKHRGLAINNWWPAGPSLGVPHGSCSVGLGMKRSCVALSEVHEEWRSAGGLFCVSFVNPGEVNDNWKPFSGCIRGGRLRNRI